MKNLICMSLAGLMMVLNPGDALANSVPLEDDINITEEERLRLIEYFDGVLDELYDVELGEEGYVEINMNEYPLLGATVLGSFVPVGEHNTSQAVENMTARMTRITKNMRQIKWYYFPEDTVRGRRGLGLNDTGQNYFTFSKEVPVNTSETPASRPATAPTRTPAAGTPATPARTQATAAPATGDLELPRPSSVERGAGEVSAHHNPSTKTVVQKVAVKEVVTRGIPKNIVIEKADGTVLSGRERTQFARAFRRGVRRHFVVGPLGRTIFRPLRRARNTIYTFRTGRSVLRSTLRSGTKWLGIAAGVGAVGLGTGYALFTEEGHANVARPSLIVVLNVSLFLMDGVRGYTEQFRDYLVSVQEAHERASVAHEVGPPEPENLGFQGGFTVIDETGREALRDGDAPDPVDLSDGVPSQGGGADDESIISEHPPLNLSDLGAGEPPISSSTPGNGSAVPQFFTEGDVLPQTPPVSSSPPEDGDVVPSQALPASGSPPEEEDAAPQVPPASNSSPQGQNEERVPDNSRLRFILPPGMDDDRQPVELLDNDDQVQTEQPASAGL